MFEFTEEEMRIANIITNRFPTWWQDDAKSLALAGIWTYRDKFDGGGTYSGWIYTCAYRYVVEAHRLEFGRLGYAKNAALRSQVSIGSGHATPENSPPSPEQVIVDGDGNLSHLAEGWTAKQRSIVQGLVNGKLKQEIAEEMGVTPGRISHLLKPLKAAM